MKNEVIEAFVGLPLFDHATEAKAAQKTNVPAKKASPKLRHTKGGGEFPPLIRKWGETWELEEGRDEATLYRRVRDGKISGWLVFRHRVYTKERRAYGRVYPPGVFRVPSAEDFGRYAWNYTAKGRHLAEEKLKQIVEP